MSPRKDPSIGASRYRAVVIGGSAGGLEAVTEILGRLPADFDLPVVVVEHLHAEDAGRFAEHLARTTVLQVIEPCDKEPVLPGCVYAAPANYHTLLERDGTIALTIDEKVNWSRPSIDVVFESAARAYGEGLVAVVLSGANDDGAEGMKAVKAFGGMTIAQDPDSAGYPVMPRAAIDAARVDHVLPPAEIADLLRKLGAASAREAPSHRRPKKG